MATENKIVDTLSLISLKVAPNVFDLSSSMHHVSIRDQMVRSQILVRDLLAADPNVTDILIVGAGVAGLTAALSAAEHGVNVVVLETKSRLFSLFRGITNRHVGPFMYEWPQCFFDDQSYPSGTRTPWAQYAKSPLKWSSLKPMSAAQLAKKLTISMNKARASSAFPKWPVICTHVPVDSVKQLVKNFVYTESERHRAKMKKLKVPPPLDIDLTDFGQPYQEDKLENVAPQYVFLAAGMGRESLKLVTKDKHGNAYSGENPKPSECKRFWAKDTLLDAKTCDERVAIFGGGDGALQDVLRALTGRPHPLEILDELVASATVMQALHGVRDQLLVLDRQARQFATWTAKSNEYVGLDNTCRSIARQLARDPKVVAQVAKVFRKGAGVVELVVREAYFDKAYFLNRFMVHLLWACQQKAKRWPGRMELVIHFESYACGYKKANGQHEIQILQSAGGRVRKLNADTIAVRYGIDADTIPGGQMIQLSPKKSGIRTKLARIELPYIFE